MTTLVLLPGLLCDEELWARQRDQLRGEAEIMVPDLTAHDEIDALAAKVLAAAPPRFALGGLSMGGYVALAIMRLAPERVERLALLDTSARADTDEAKDKRRALIALSESGKFKGVTPRLLPSLLQAQHVDRPDITQPIFDMAARIGPAGFRRQQTAIMNRIDSRAFLLGISCPVLVAVGIQDQITPPPVAEEMASAIPGAKLKAIPECGHLSPLEQPAKVSALLAEWLRA